ncbi:MAG: CatB-related O-acetyltransferase [Proteobacteria bacterium]|nr:CatB-related O-acetyltransferase [Pseudomonadota bacterium]MBU1417870.1 CatB-related O-acetyltransferase [Pseudomonadota bacterium]MBU1453392.1 CatB-related O-acetyltransferase [Pseudomonadota bacterium]
MRFSRQKKQPLTRDRFSNPNLSIGNHTYGEPTILTFDQTTRLSIGCFCSISDKVTIILGGNHRTDWLTTYPFPAFKQIWPEAAEISGHPGSKGDISIGNDIWIGYGATILSGVTIGSGAVIGAESVVTDDVAPYAIVAGNPARERKKRFDQSTIEALLHLAWWDWPEEKIRKNLSLLCSNQVKQLLAQP